MGGPKPFITGLGTDTNKSTLAEQKILFERTLKAIQEQISQIIINGVFSVIAKQHKFHSIPELVWEEISTESLDSKADRLVKYVNANLLIPDEEIRNIIRQSERLPKENLSETKDVDEGIINGKSEEKK